MNQFLERTLTHLSGNGNIDLVSKEELKRLTQEYPYFSIGQMLLAKKLKAENDSNFLPQVQKAALYFSNPYWLHYQLLNAAPSAPIMHKGNSQEALTSTEEVLPAEEKISFPPATPKFSRDHIAASGDLAKVVLTDGDDNIDSRQLVYGPSTLLPQENVEPVSATVTEDEDIDVRKQATTEHDIETEDRRYSPNAETDDSIKSESAQQTVVENVPITTEFSLEEIKASDELAHETLAEVDPEVGSEPKFILPGEMPAPDNVPITTEFSLEEIRASDELAHETLAEVDTEASGEPRFMLPEPSDITLADTVNQPVETIAGQLPEEVNTADGSVQETETETIQQPEAKPGAAIPMGQPETIETGEDDEMDNATSNEMLKNIKSILDAPLQQKDPAKTTSLVPIDPYHTVDYFASQGIKLILEKDPKDKLGRQLKSFTQWLKHMKKLGPEDATDEVSDTEAEATIIKIADFSNTQREIITEAMANVLEKQGKTDKAVQIYIKLSFLFPDKSAYFADKIKNLKGIR